MSGLEQYFSEQLPELLRVLQNSDALEIEIDEGPWRLRLRRAPTGIEYEELPMESRDEAVLETAENVMRITSPLVGTFYRAGDSGVAPLASEGDEVKPNTVVGIVEALHVLTDVEAGCAGRITAVLATDGQAVEYGQTLFEVESRG